MDNVMQIINNFRAHVLNHSSAAEKIGKHDLACKIVTVKQEKNEDRCSKLINKICRQHDLIQTMNKNAKTKKERISHAQNKIQYNEKKLNKLLDNQGKYQKITATIKSPYKTEMTSAQVLSQLTSKLNESPELLKTEGIFRLAVASGGPTVQAILTADNMEALVGKFGEDPGIVISNAIKKEFDNALTLEDRANISALVDKCSNDKTFIPSLAELPGALRDVIITFQRVAEYSYVNKMSASSLSPVLAMKLVASPDQIVSYQDFINRCIDQ